MIYKHTHKLKIASLAFQTPRIKYFYCKDLNCNQVFVVQIVNNVWTRIARF